MSKQFGLGRQPAPDGRDILFPMMAIADRDAQASDVGRLMRYWNAQGIWLDQGALPACCGYSAVTLVEDGPVTQPSSKPGEIPIIDPIYVYREAQKIDEWPGEDYDGTSVRAAMKVLQREGLITGYNWAWDVDSIVAALLHSGPVIMGTTWFTDMFSPNSAGVVTPTGSPVGGHAYVLNGVNTRLRMVRGKNTWGRGWGKHGFFYMSFASLARLLLDEGEAVIPAEIRVKK